MSSVDESETKPVKITKTIARILFLILKFFSLYLDNMKTGVLFLFN